MLATGSDTSPTSSCRSFHRPTTTRLETYRLWRRLPRLSSDLIGERKSAHGLTRSARTSSPSCFITARRPRSRPSPPTTRAPPSRRRPHRTLSWTSSDDAALRVLDSMDDELSPISRVKHPDSIPPRFAAGLLARSGNSWRARRTNLRGCEPRSNSSNLATRPRRRRQERDGRSAPRGHAQSRDGTTSSPAVEYLHRTDPAWASEWVAVQVAEGVLYWREHWMQFAPVVPAGLG